MFISIIVFFVAFIAVLYTCGLTDIYPLLPGLFFPFYFAFDYGWGDDGFLTCLFGDFFMLTSLIAQIICIIQIVKGIRMIAKKKTE